MKKTKEFESEVVKETLYGVVGNFGTVKNRMTLGKAKSEFFIEWVVDIDGQNEEVVEIGIWTEDNKVTDYDGVFELPKQAIELLKENGFDTSEIEINEGGET